MPDANVAAADVVERDLVAEAHIMASQEHADGEEFDLLVDMAAEITRLREEVAELRKPPGETIGWSRETLAELMSARDQIASDRRCTSRDRCAASSAIFRNCDCMQSAVWRRTSR